MPRANFKELVDNIIIPKGMIGTYLDSKGFYIVTRKGNELVVPSSEYGSPTYAWEQINKHISKRLSSKT